MYTVLSTRNYQEWFVGLTNKTQGLINARIERILDQGHFGDARQLQSNLAELKWKSGLRIYFTIIRDKESRLVVLLLGGNKNSQNSDIKRAKKILNSIQKV